MERRVTVNKNYKPRAELSDEKSKLGLSEIYEKQYLEEIHGVKEKDALEKQHEQVEALFQKLCRKVGSIMYGSLFLLICF